MANILPKYRFRTQKQPLLIDYSYGVPNNIENYNYNYYFGESISMQAKSTCEILFGGERVPIRWQYTVSGSSNYSDTDIFSLGQAYSIRPMFKKSDWTIEKIMQCIPIYNGIVSQDYMEQSLQPIWGDGLALQYEKKDDECFFRKKLSQSLVFVDYDYPKSGLLSILKNATHSHIFRIFIDYSTDNGVSWIKNYAEFFFSKQDVNFDIDNKKTEIKVNENDEYTDLVARMNEEFNCLEFAKTYQEVKIPVEPIIQVYIQGSDRITNITAGSSEVVSTNYTCATDYIGENQMLENNFAISDWIAEINIISNDNNINGLYSGLFSTGHFGYCYKQRDDNININKQQEALFLANFTNINNPLYFLDISVSIGVGNYLNVSFVLKRGNKFFSIELGRGGYTNIIGGRNLIFPRYLRGGANIPNLPNITMSDGSILSVSKNIRAVGMRLATANPQDYSNDWYGKRASSSINSSIGGDIAPVRNFPYYQPYHNHMEDTSGATGLIYTSTLNTTEITEFGQLSGMKNRFFVGKKEQYDQIEEGINAPLMKQVDRSSWYRCSIWCRNYDPLTYLRESDQYEKKEPFGISLEDMVNGFLQKISPQLNFSRQNSLFFSNIYLMNGIGRKRIGSYRNTDFFAYFIPNSNISNLTYTERATKQNLTFGELLLFLRIYFNLYWHISGNNFIIEHRMFYENGGQYDYFDTRTNSMKTAGNKSVFSVSNMIANRVGKAWDYLTNSYSYTGNETKTIETRFYNNGNSPLFSDGKINNFNRFAKSNETRTVSKINTDLEYILYSENPNTNGLLFVELSNLTDTGNYVTIGYLDRNATSNIDKQWFEYLWSYMPQLSNWFLFDRFHRYKLPSNLCMMQNIFSGKNDKEINYFENNAEQEFQLPIISDIPPETMIAMSDGNWNIESYEVNLSSRMSKFKLSRYIP